MDIFWKRKYKINKENEIMVKSELGYLIFKLVFDIIVENVLYIIVEREIVMKSEGIYYFFLMILDLVFCIIVIRL